jgi:hypothetical protein
VYSEQRLRDPHHFNADPDRDPAFDLNAEPDTEPTFHFNADADLYPLSCSS